MKKAINIIFLLIILLTLTTSVYAATLNLDVTSNKEKVNVDDEIIITIDWQEGMQAADFILNYDSNKFQFININIEDTFYKVEDNRIKIAWFSLDNTDKTSIDITFKAVESGKAKFETKIDGGFATGELVIPDNYNTGSVSVKVNGIVENYIIPVIIVAAIIIIIIALIGIKKKKSHKR